MDRFLDQMVGMLRVRAAPFQLLTDALTWVQANFFNNLD